MKNLFLTLMCLSFSCLTMGRITNPTNIAESYCFFLQEMIGDKEYPWREGIEELFSPDFEYWYNHAKAFSGYEEVEKAFHTFRASKKWKSMGQVEIVEGAEGTSYVVNYRMINARKEEYYVVVFISCADGKRINRIEEVRMRLDSSESAIPERLRTATGKC